MGIIHQNKDRFKIAIVKRYFKRFISVPTHVRIAPL